MTQLDHDAAYQSFMQAAQEMAAENAKQQHKKQSNGQIQAEGPAIRTIQGYQAFDSIQISHERHYPQRGPGCRLGTTEMRQEFSSFRYGRPYRHGQKILWQARQAMSRHLFRIRGTERIRGTGGGIQAAPWRTRAATVSMLQQGFIAG
jgi:hypothetical protein